MAVTTDTDEEIRLASSHALVRLVPPGGYKLCMHCHQTIGFVPSGDRIQVTCKVFVDGALQRIELFHPECYSECRHPYGEPVG